MRYRSGVPTGARRGRTARRRAVDLTTVSRSVRRAAAVPAPNMIKRQQQDSTDVRDRIDGYLKRSDLTQREPRVVPLTGDASDRRYFRVLIPDAASIVLSLYSEAFDFDTLPFVNVARLLLKMPVPIPALLGHAGDRGAAPPRRRARLSGIPALRCGIRRRKAHVGARFFHQALHRGVSRHRDFAAGAPRAQAGVRCSHRLARRGA